MALTVGSRNGHYDVVALIGEGGMGQVYQATDTKLNRQVALKILPEAFAADPDRLARFQREAQVLASLNHPGIAAIYGIEELDPSALRHDSGSTSSNVEGAAGSGQATQALVLELVEGPTLADRIAQGPIPIDEALPIAKQIAEALEAAHEAGVIHRDLKPANIKVREDGTVKVLDFGLAKALDTTPEGDPSQSPTLTAAATQMGVIMGTAAYMSPEQARGKSVDRRADIWAFGAVLFEMLSGKPAFAGEDVTHTLARVVEREPDWDLLPTETPAVAQSIVRRSLRKSARDRLPHLGVVRLDLSLGERGVSNGPPRQGASVFAVATGSLLLGAVAGWFLGVALASSASRDVVSRFAVVPPPGADLAGGAGYEVIMSPDGSRLVYVARTEDDRTQLMERRLDSMEVRLLPDTQSASDPFFAPDGSWVGFESALRGALMSVPLAGGPSQELWDQSSTRGVTASTDGTLVVAQADSLLRIPPGGGPAVLLSRADRSQNERAYSNPSFLPDGRHVLFDVATADGRRIAVIDVDGGELRVVLEGGNRPRYVPTGHLVFGRDSTVMAVPFDLASLSTVGTAVAIADDVRQGPLGAGGTDFAVSDTGVLAYVTGDDPGESTQLVWVDRAGNQTELPMSAGMYGIPRLSPEGTRLALTVGRSNNSDIWVIDLERQTESRLTFDSNSDRHPIWSPDGERIVFRSRRDAGVDDLYWRNADGTGQVERLTTPAGGMRTAYSFSPDGRYLTYSEMGSTGDGDLHLFSTDEQTSRPLLQTRFRESRGEISPDGRWLAYQSPETGQDEIFVVPFPDTDDGKWIISDDGGHSAAWSPDGTELFYRTGRSMMVVPVGVVDGRFERGAPRELFSGDFQLSLGRNYDVDQSGERFLMVTPRRSDLGASGSRIIVVQNWIRDLDRLLPN